MGERPNALRVAFLAGVLTKGGAELQLLYMARALREAGVCVRIYTFGENEFYEAVLRDAGVAPIRIGGATHPVSRLVRFARALWQFSPDVVQAVHFYVNLYVALASRLVGSLGIGAIPSDVMLDVQDAGRWGVLSLHAPAALWTNSLAGRRNAIRAGISGAKIHVVENVMDSAAFDRARSMRPAVPNMGHVIAIFVARLIPVKRTDRFLEALALARRSVPGLKGVVVGDGPARASLEAQARRLGLLPDGVEFRGASNDVPGALAEADMLVLTSDHEGLPNVILEAMAARLPVVTTPAGDAAVIVEDGLSGFVVPFGAVDQLAERLVRLARSPALRRDLGEKGYVRVTTRHAPAGLADRLVAMYRAAARQRGPLHLRGKSASDAGARTTLS